METNALALKKCSVLMKTTPEVSVPLSISLWETQVTALQQLAAMTSARCAWLFIGPIRRRYGDGLAAIVSPQESDAARQELLVKEKEFTRARDALAAQRRRMPRMAVEKDDLFDGRRQLIVYRFFLPAHVDGWPDGGCARCSMLADPVAHLAHLNARDTCATRSEAALVGG
jgi:hypothetical protein